MCFSNSVNLATLATTAMKLIFRRVRPVFDDAPNRRIHPTKPKGGSSDVSVLRRQDTAAASIACLSTFADGKHATNLTQAPGGTPKTPVLCLAFTNCSLTPPPQKKGIRISIWRRYDCCYCCSISRRGRVHCRRGVLRYPNLGCCWENVLVVPLGWRLHCWCIARKHLCENRAGDHGWLRKLARNAVAGGLVSLGSSARGCEVYRQRADKGEKSHTISRIG